MAQTSPWIILPIAALLCLAAWIAWVHLDYVRACRNRKARLRERELLDEQAWFERYFPAEPAVRDEVAELCRAFEWDLGVPWTLLRPTDRLSELTIRGKGFSDEDLECFGCVWDDWAIAKGVWPADVADDTIGAILHGAARALERGGSPMRGFPVDAREQR